MKDMTYAGVGVDYDAMDPFKRLAQLAGRGTAHALKRFGLTEVEMSRGESAYLIEAPSSYIAHVEEGLGTKNLVADEMYQRTGHTFYDGIAQDTVAMIVNDMITLGALPLSVAMHLAVGSSDWFKDEKRVHDLVEGWQKACLLARCVWGGGETPTLKKCVCPDAVVLSGSAIGTIQPKSRLITPDKIQHGDSIIIAESSGIHANGLTLAREIAEKLPARYLTNLPDGKTYGESLLAPTHIYVPVIEDCAELGVDVHYAVNVTGHGWRKLMRAQAPFAYVIERLPKQLPIFDFIQEHGPVTDEEAYGNLNMGAGFVLYVPEYHEDKALHAIRRNGLDAFVGGYVENSADKKVIIQPKGLEYLGSTLGVR